MSTISRAVVFLALLLPGAVCGQMVFGSSQLSGPAVTPPPMNTPPEQRCVLQGRAVNAQTGEPLKKVSIRLIKRGSGGSIGSAGMAMPIAGAQGYSATSDGEGSFRINNIEPGDYNLTGERTGFLHTSYGAKGPAQGGTILSFSPSQQMTDITLSLMPQAVVSGKITDEDGDPVQGAMVQVLRSTWQNGKLQYLPHGGSSSNDLGEFRSANLTPGKYYVCAQKMNFGMPDQQEIAVPGKPEVRPIRTCYPDAVGISDATPLDIRAGQDLPGINIRLHSAATYHVRGKVVGNLPSGSDSERQVSVNLSLRDEEAFMMIHPSFLGKDNSFDISGVAPGSYTLNVYAMGGRFHTLASQTLEVGQGDVNNLVVNTITPGTVHAQILFDGTPQSGTATASASNVHVRLQPIDASSMMNSMPNGEPKPDGSLTFENVFPGKYRLETNAPAGTYLKTIRFGGQESTDREIDLSQGASGDLVVVFRYGAAEVDGTVQAASSSSASGSPASAPTASLVFVPDPPAPDLSGMHFGNTNQSASFTVKGLAPGHYRAYAFEQLNMNQLQNPELLKQLESRGTEIEVKENDRKSIQLTLISSDDLQQIYSQLGIDPTQ